jgi:hypothetical protein
MRDGAITLCLPLQFEFVNDGDGESPAAVLRRGHDARRQAPVESQPVGISRAARCIGSETGPTGRCADRAADHRMG